MVNKKSYDIYLNLCEGLHGDEVAGAEVVEMLERLNVAYTGARPNYYSMSKLAMKMCAHSCGVTFMISILYRIFAI